MDDLGDLVRQEWHALMARRDLRVEMEDGGSVTLHSGSVAVIVSRDRGQLSVSVFPLATGCAADGWQYDGMVGKASEARLLQIAAERMEEDPRVLQGDRDLFAQIATERRRLSEEWTTYYARKGPRPKSGRLP
jgi:hypothetical protein